MPYFIINVGDWWIMKNSGFDANYDSSWTPLYFLSDLHLIKASHKI